MNKTLKTWLNTAIPETLWHYTDSNAFFSIVEAGKMRATEIRFMNDSEEYIHAQKIVLDRIEKMPDQSDIHKLAKNSLFRIVKSFFESGSLSKQRIQVFVVSLTKLKDSLSQWDRYGDLSRGIALGFDLSKLRPEPESGTLVTFAPCVYDDEEKVRLVDDSLGIFLLQIIQLTKNVDDKKWAAKRVIEWTALYPEKSFLASRQEFDDWNQKFINEEVNKAATRLAGELLQLCTICKHSGFREESEWRLILPIGTDKVLVNAERKSRVRGVEQVPYIETRLTFDESQPLPLSRVMLGPLYAGKSFEISTNSPSGEPMPVSKSCIPYRR